LTFVISYKPNDRLHATDPRESKHSAGKPTRVPGG
jgi:hypothetical protein